VEQRIALAQLAPRLGRVDDNFELARDWLRRGAAEGAQLVAFPELALTGYLLSDLVPEVAMGTDDPRLAALSREAPGVLLAIGFVEETDAHRFCNSAGLLRDGELIGVHRKVYLPTYGIFDDGRYFGPGDRFDVFTSAVGPAGIAICEDLWHASVPYLYGSTGATVVLSPASSPGRGVAEGGDLGTAESCRLMDRFYAQYLTLYVVFANRVGHEDGIAFWGGSEVVAPDGTVVARAPDFEEQLLVAEVDPDLVARERDRNPLIRDERPDLVVAQLMRTRGMAVKD